MFKDDKGLPGLVAVPAAKEIVRKTHSLKVGKGKIFSNGASQNKKNELNLKRIWLKLMN